LLRSSLSFFGLDELVPDDSRAFEPDRNFFQCFMRVFDRLITSSSLLDFLSAFTVIPMRVFVRTSKLMFRVCNCFSKSRACS
jgi:hypothetical protein